MTLNGYYFTATGITEYAFFHGDRNTLRVVHDSMPNAPVRLYTASGMEFVFSAPFNWEESPFSRKMPDPGASFPRPPWLGKEISGDPRYTNAALSCRPWSLWRDGK